ncbi:MarR family transcriptional regulator [Rhizobium pusense]|uniref:MarR family winged helix-turn-helix transcriptional regulator n=1 Tax=Agrobacterium pusense TaxID=648995 RepID=UPI00129A36C4|nr:MarR family winged helix-turn-helix transcriptional regulator [Agrobacterium pusense]MRG66060.1 MarR family transcriptional regulator [Agrobacterium pusense]
MPSTINVQNTHMSKKIRDLHGSLIDIVSLMNQPQRDEMLVREAGIALDRALFPLLVGIERRGPIGIVDLAAGVGRDYTTVSRQVAKLENLGLAERRQSPVDRRVNEAVVTAKGKAMTDKIDAARERIALAVFASWETAEVNDLVRLMRKFADALGGATASPDAGETVRAE